MPLTPTDVANKLFSKEFRGYAMDEVDTFLDQVEAELRRLLIDIAELQQQGPATAPPPAVTEGAAPVAPVSFPPAESQEAALRTLLMAQRTADQAIAEARAEAAALVDQARQRSAQVDAEVNARTASALAELAGRRQELEQRIEDLRSFEREYRQRLKAYLASQLRDLDIQGGGGADDAGTGVPQAARTAAVGVVPGAMTDGGATRPAGEVPGGPSGGPSDGASDGAAPATAPAAASAIVPAAAPAPAAAPRSASAPLPSGPPGGSSGSSSGPTPATPPTPPTGPAPVSASERPGAPAGPARAAPAPAAPSQQARPQQAPPQRPVPPLPQRDGPGPSAPPAPMVSRVEQVDDGPEPPAQS